MLVKTEYHKTKDETTHCFLGIMGSEDEANHPSSTTTRAAIERSGTSTHLDILTSRISTHCRRCVSVSPTALLPFAIEKPKHDGAEAVKPCQPERNKSVGVVGIRSKGLHQI